MALGATINDNRGLDRTPVDGGTDPVADRCALPEPPWLTHEEAVGVLREKYDRREFDRWRHLPTLELHYYPRGTEPENPQDYVRFLP